MATHRILFFLVHLDLGYVFYVQNGVVLEGFKETHFTEAPERVDIARFLVNSEGETFFVTLADEFGVFSKADLRIETAGLGIDLAATADHGTKSGGCTGEIAGLYH